MIFLPNDYYETYERFQIKENDLLIAMTGATIGKVGIYEDVQNALLNQRNGIIRSNDVNTYFIIEKAIILLFLDSLKLINLLKKPFNFEFVSYCLR